jgi:single-strand DNA-binding protein
MIKLQAIGNLGKDAVINKVGDKTVINFTVAHSEKYKDQQGQLQDRTIWVDCAYWTERAVGQYLLKGKTVFVEGTPHVETYTTKDGRQGASLRLRVMDMQFVGGNRDGAQQGGDGQQQQGAQMPQNAPQQNQQQFAQPQTPQQPQFNAPSPAQNFASPAQNIGGSDDLPF